MWKISSVRCVEIPLTTLTELMPDLAEPLIDHTPQGLSSLRSGRSLTYRLAVWVVFFFFGIGPWLLVNAIVVELSALEKELPEGKRIGSMVGAATQVGNLAIPLCMVLRRLKLVSMANLTTSFLALAVLDAVLVSFLWYRTANMPSAVSLWLLLLTAIAGMVGCASKVTHFPFAARLLDPALISAVSTGFGVSGLVPVLMAYAQGIATTSDPTALRFGVSVFFRICFGILSFSLITLLTFLYTHRKSHHTTVMKSEDIEKHTKGFESSEDSNSARRDASWPHVVWANRRVLLNQLISNAVNYSVYPGMFSYLQQGTGHMFWLTAVYYSGNSLGRWLPTVIHIYALEALNMIQVPLYVFFFWKVVQTDVHVPFGVLLACLAVFSTINGFLSTMVAQHVAKHTQSTHKELIFQLLGICGQLGSFIGTYLTLIMAMVDVF